MRLFSLKFTLFLLLAITTAQAQQFNWIKGGGSTADLTPDGVDYWEKTEYMCTDAQGNVYALSQVGYPSVTADTFYTTSSYSAANILVTSYTCDGRMRWAKVISTTAGIDIANGIGVDNMGHVYVAGFMQPAGGSLHIGYDTTLSGTSVDDLGPALVQLDTSGHFKWIRFVGTNSYGTLHGISDGGAFALDGAGNAHFFTYLKSGVPLMPGVTSNHNEYDLAYNSAGTLLSATQLGIDSAWTVNSAAIDPVTNKLYVSGEINLGIYGTLITDSFYAAAFDVNRNLLWQYFASSEYSNGLSAVVLDKSKHLHFAGSSESSTTASTRFIFNNDSVLNTHFPLYAMSVILTTDTNGTPLWIKHFDNNSGVAPLVSIINLPHGKIAAAGFYAETVTDGVGTIVTAFGVGQNAYFVVVDSEGDLQDIQSLRGDGFWNGAYAITADTVGNIYVGGYVEDSIWGGTPPIPAYHSVGGNTDFFITKYGVDCGCRAMPVASFTYTGTHLLSTTYTGTTAGLDSVVWHYGDGITGTGLTSTHTYTATGTYQLCGTVYTSCGRDSTCQDVVVVCVGPPVASFIDTGVFRIGVNYTGTTYLLDSVAWNYGSGYIDTGRVDHHTYTAPGTYTICAIAYTGCGNDTICNAISVPCISAPVAAFTHTGTGVLNVTYSGTTTGVDSIGWNFGDGYRTDGSTATHSYTTPGTYQVCVVAYSPCGSDTSCTYDTVICSAAPTVSFTDTGTRNIGVAYTGSVLALDSVVWSFGDGTIDTGLSAAHSYTATGVYTVCATAYSACGNTTSCQNDTVVCVIPPVASFTAIGADTFSFHYTGGSAGLDSLVWTFGDGTTGHGLIAPHTYSVAGTYRVCATVYTLCGVDSFCMNITAVIRRVGVANIATSTINVFPNPTTDELEITGIEENTGYLLLTVTGVSMQQGTLQPGNNTISMKNYAPGIYILEMTGIDGERKIVRVVKE